VQQRSRNTKTGRSRSCLRRTGFSLLELMIVVAIIAILAMIALPSFQGRILRDQTSEALALTDFVKQRVAIHYATTKAFPADNAAADLPPADRIVNKVVSAVTVRDGAITLTFGNQAHRALAGKRLSLRPAFVPDFPQVPISWICGGGPVPEKMKLNGSDETSVETANLPIACRSPAVPK